MLQTNYQQIHFSNTLPPSLCPSFPPSLLPLFFPHPLFRVKFTAVTFLAEVTMKARGCTLFRANEYLLQGIFGWYGASPAWCQFPLVFPIAGSMSRRGILHSSGWRAQHLDLPSQHNGFWETIARQHSLTAPSLLWFLPATDSALGLVKATQWLRAELGTRREALEWRRHCNLN